MSGTENLHSYAQPQASPGGLRRARPSWARRANPLRAMEMWSPNAALRVGESGWTVRIDGAQRNFSNDEANCLASECEIDFMVVQAVRPRP